MSEIDLFIDKVVVKVVTINLCYEKPHEKRFKDYESTGRIL